MAVMTNGGYIEATALLNMKAGIMAAAGVYPLIEGTRLVHGEII
jgi:hypothetical protein